jgi:hypothetical protein
VSTKTAKRHDIKTVVNLVMVFANPDISMDVFDGTIDCALAGKGRVFQKKTL